MLFRQLFDKTSSTYTYLLAANHKAIMIDPVLEQILLYETLLNELDLELAMAIDTHMHADHITAAGELRKKHHCDIVMGSETHAKGVTHYIKDNDFVGVDGLALKALHTPGHTKDSYSFLMNDRIFTGDTLFIGSSGRTDFEDGNPFEAYDSIFNKLLTLPEDTLLYPGHDYNGKEASTIGEEKKYNPRLQVHSAQEYASIMNNLNLPQPKLAHIAIPLNLKCGLKETQEIEDE